MRRRDGQIATFTYDILGRQTLKNLPGTANDVHYGYDVAGRQTSAKLLSTSGQGLTNVFDALGRLTSVTDTTGGGSRTVSYLYDEASRRTRMTWAGFYVNYSYKDDGSLYQIQENGSAALATYAYDANGRRTSMTYGNGAVTNYAYDPLSRLSSLTSNLSGTANDLTTTFQYNPASQISELTRSNDAYAWQDHYNVDRPYSVNGLNQLTTAGALSLTYDNRGNLTSDGTNSYTYDIENRLITGPSGVTLSYDPYGRLAKTTGSATTRKGYDGADLIAEFNASGTLLRRYVHGDGSDDPILWYEGTGTTDKRYMHKDERGSVIALTNGSGAIVGINAYDDYGIPAATNIGRFQYTGQQYLADLGLYHYKARIYSPTLGRFLQTDPIGYGDGMNLYAYVGGDPVNGIDPTGLGCVTLVGYETHCPPRLPDDSGGGVSGRAGHSNPGFGGNGSGGVGGGDSPPPPPPDCNTVPADTPCVIVVTGDPESIEGYELQPAGWDGFVHVMYPIRPDGTVDYGSPVSTPEALQRQCDAYSDAQAGINSTTIMLFGGSTVFGGLSFTKRFNGLGFPTYALGTIVGGSLLAQSQTPPPAHCNQ